MAPEATLIVRSCVDCRREFDITEREQQWFAARRDATGQPFALPKRCKACRAIRKFEPPATRDRAAQIGR